MESHFNKIRTKIIYNGYMTESQILMEMSGNSKNTKKIFSMLNDDPEIHKIEYTNRYIFPYCSRVLYFYNPNKKKRKRKSSK